MARYTTPSTNVNFLGDLSTPFSLGSTNISLNLAGQRIYPRKDSGGTGVSELRGKTYLYAIADVVVYDIDLDIVITSGGTVEVTSPMTITAATSISISPTYIIDDDTYSTITLKYNPSYGYIFYGWSDQAGITISGSNPATMNLSTASLHNATQIRALVAN